MSQNRFSRRHFFYGSLLAGAVPAGGFGSTASLKSLGYKSPNEKLNIASIGAGGRAAGDISGCAATENIVALCDPDDKNAAAIYKRFDKAPKYKDFRKMLDKEGKNIDAVIVAIPDFMHATAALWAMERGKHVYVREAPDPHHLGSPHADRGGRQVQGGHADGQPGLLQRRHPPLRRDDLERRDRQRHRSPRLDQPAHLAARDHRDSVPGPGPGDARLGPLAGHRHPAPVHHRRQGVPDARTAISTSLSTGADSSISAAARWATWPATSWARRTWP